MTKEEQKSLLLNDLSGRLPYGVKVGIPSLSDKVYTLKGIRIEDNMVSCELECKGIVFMPIELVRPYLFPLSSMTKEQEDEWCDICLQPLIKRLDRHTREEDLTLYAESQCVGSDWLHKNHLDNHCMIKQCLANDATNLNIY